MIQTLEAVVDKEGKVSVLTELRLKESRRALVTILDEDPKISAGASIQLPTNQTVSDEDVLSVWADRTEPAQGIARKIRESNRKTT